MPTESETHPGTREPIAAQHPTTAIITIGERVFTISRPAPRAQLAQKAQLARTLGPGLFGVIFGGVKVGGEQFPVKLAIGMLFSVDTGDPDPKATEQIKTAVRSALGPVLSTAIGQIDPDEVYGLCEHMLVDCCELREGEKTTRLATGEQLDTVHFIRDDRELFMLLKASVELCMVPFVAPSTPPPKPS